MDHLERDLSIVHNPDIDTGPLWPYKQDMVSPPFLLMSGSVHFGFSCAC